MELVDFLIAKQYRYFPDTLKNQIEARCNYLLFFAVLQEAINSLRIFPHSFSAY